MSKKKRIIIGSALAAVVVTGLIITVFMAVNKEKAYRVIKVLELDGTAVVERENVGELQAYAGMSLQSGDRISVPSNSMLVLQMDDDKYAYVEENSVLAMVAEGTSRDSKTMIQLEKGAITCHVDGKLNSSSSYEVHTQNSVMAVRGTVFRVIICGSEQLNRDFSAYTEAAVQISVYEGEVLVTLKHPDGTLGDERSIASGEKAGVGNDSTDSFFLTDEELEQLPVSEEKRQLLKALQAILEREDDLSVKEEELEELLEKLNAQTTYTVYFYANGTLFGIQEVKAGKMPLKPDLSPGENGMWNIDFTKPIIDDTEVYWVEE